MPGCGKGSILKATGLIVLGFALLAALAPHVARAKSTLETVRDRGYVMCGVTDRMPGFSNQDANGAWKGFSIDFCRALAAAVLGNGNAFKAEDLGLAALAAKEIDVLHANIGWTFARDVRDHFAFPGVYFYDGLGFIAHTNTGIHTLRDALARKALSVCALGTSRAWVNLQDYVAETKAPWKIIPLLSLDGMWRAFFGGRCDMALYDHAALLTVQAERLNGSADFVVLREMIGKELLGPVVREDDPRWRDLVSWVTLITIVAENDGITKENVDTVRANAKSREVRRLLGVEKGLGQGLGLDDAWAYRVIKSVGNYGEIFKRNLGANSKFKIPRAVNRLLRNGGVLYAPPLL